jgi:hypothetical protein
MLGMGKVVRVVVRVVVHATVKVLVPVGTKRFATVFETRGFVNLGTLASSTTKVKDKVVQEV